MKYWNCRWCSGRGCNQCQIEADKAYKQQFPNGPQPIATFKRDDPAQMGVLKKHLHADVIAKAFDDGGPGAVVQLAYDAADDLEKLKSPAASPQKGVIPRK